MPRKYKAGPDVKPDEKLYDSKGHLVDDDYIERAVAGVHRQLGPGRPSLTGPGEVSPELKARVSAELKTRVERAAKQQGKPVSMFIREGSRASSRGELRHKFQFRVALSCQRSYAYT